MTDPSMTTTAQNPGFWHDYSEFDRDLRVKHAKVGCVLALILMPAGLTLDYFVYPQFMWKILESRLLTDAFILPVFLLLFTAFGRRWISILGSLWALCCAVDISWMVWLTEGAWSPYYAGLNLVILITCNLMPYTWKDAFTVCALTLGLYVTAILLHRDLQGREDLLRNVFNNLYFITLTGIISVTACHYFSLSRIEDFRLRHRLDRQNHQLNDSYSKLTEMDRLRSQFFANISHELRTPLTLIVGPLEDILRSGHRLPDKFAEGIGIARQNGLRLLKLINDLLEVVRVDEKQIDLKRETLDLAVFVPGVAESIRYLIEAKALTLACSGQIEPLVVAADPARLEKVLLNLLTNAIKFTPKGGTISVRWSSRAGKAVVEVEDTGVGIPAASLPSIFDRFRQVDGSSTRKYQGAGIGLALARDLMIEHGGTIEVRSELGKGTVLTIALTLEAASLVAPVPAPIEHDPLSEIYRSAERRGGLTLDEGVSVEGADSLGVAGAPTILVVDDEPDMRRYIVSRLVDRYRVVQSDHGERALEVARRERPDLIVLDLMLPGIDGLDVCRAIRKDPSMADTKIILLTARMDEDSKITALECGADDFLTKPFSTIEVVTRIAGLLRTVELQKTVKARALDLERALAKLKDAESQLVQSEKMSALGTIAAGLLHEINNPLNYTITALQVGLKLAPKEDQELKDVLEDIGQGMRRVKDIVSDLGMFAFKSKGQDQDRMDVAAVIESALRLTSHELAGIQVTRDFAPAAIVLGSKTQLSHVFMNLLINSTKAVKSVPGRSPAITISTRVEGVRLRVCVRDNGAGIAAEVLPRIFEPFFTTREVGQGMGLGLSICHTIVSNHGGTIAASSVPGEWTEMTFDLPLAPTPMVDRNHEKELVR